MLHRRSPRLVGLSPRVVDLVLTGPGHYPRDNTAALCRALRAGAPKAVLVVLSGAAEEIGVAAALDQGADDCLDPSMPDVELLARLRAHLRRGAGGPRRRPTRRCASGHCGSIPRPGGSRSPGRT